MSETSGRGEGRRAIVDAHVHLFDHAANRQEFLERRDETFEALVGDYSRLPRTYLLHDYLRDSAARRVEGIVWHEFLSEDPVREAGWGQALADASPIPQVMVAQVQFRDPGSRSGLTPTGASPTSPPSASTSRGTPDDPLRRFAARSDLLTDPAWRAGLSSLRLWDVACGLEVFAHQLPDMLDVVRLQPDIRFTFAVMGWPLDVTADGRERWRRGVVELSRCENVCASISAVECLLGMDWTVDRARPWVQTLIDLFGPDRCMLGSHLPVVRPLAQLRAALRRLRGACRGPLSRRAGPPVPRHSDRVVRPRPARTRGGWRGRPQRHPVGEEGRGAPAEGYDGPTASGSAASSSGASYRYISSFSGVTIASCTTTPG
jgi:predicted TIM-barrel fold metal-dependent hydrolase